MATNYKSCPLKKRPFVFLEEKQHQPQTEALALTKTDQLSYAAPIAAPQEEQPQDLSLKRKANDDFEDYEIPAKREYVLNLSKVPETERPTTPPMRAIIKSEPLCSALLSPPVEPTDYQHQQTPTDIHMRGLTPATAGYTTNPYQSAFVMAAGCNPISALWSSYQPHINGHLAAAFPSPANSFASAASPHSVYSYQHMTPPSSPGSDASSEPEDLSVRSDIPLPALFHNFDEVSASTSYRSYTAAASAPANNASAASKNYRFKCDKCQKMYSTSMGLSKHQQFHCPAAECNQEKKQHSCEECGKMYTSVGALKMHIRTHTLPCKCPICGKAFSRPWLLQGHIRTHTGEKPFQCPDCPRSFADRSNLRAHQQTHVDVKKYACQVCHKSFSRMSLLNKHISSNCTITIA
ncbi:protein snail [Scaptodrosophila lebanonensis]|uniref:Protein snail n=1 Tax=Drosophila lebanonensis TaxID=7225 RepID=A0A6J2U7G9_DROLE|nr:protein snail [Scaptodrosophila lebanonensis]